MLGSVQDGNREWISLLACISATGVALRPTLVFRSESGDYQKAWLQDYDPATQCAYFATSESGWTFEEIGITWLKRVFAQHTKCGDEWRMLIVDGHSSHVNMAFISICEEERIILIILPPHSTHRLQPLDVGIFSPLANAYSKELGDFIYNGYGWERMTKANFWNIFYPAWRKALTVDNIKGAFRATGIQPFKPDAVLKQLTIDLEWEDEEGKESQVQSLANFRAFRSDSRKLNHADPVVKKLCTSLEEALVLADIV